MAGLILTRPCGGCLSSASALVPHYCSKWIRTVPLRVFKGVCVVQHESARKVAAVTAQGVLSRYLCLGYLADMEQLYVTGKTQVAHYVFFLVVLGVLRTALGVTTVCWGRWGKVASPSYSLTNLQQSFVVRCCVRICEDLLRASLQTSAFFLPHRSTVYSKACWRNLN